MNRTEIILCVRKEYGSHHRRKGLSVAYINRKTFIKTLPKIKKGTCNMSHEDEACNIPFTFEESVRFSIEMFTKS